LLDSPSSIVNEECEDANNVKDFALKLKLLDVPETSKDKNIKFEIPLKYKIHQIPLKTSHKDYNSMLKSMKSKRLMITVKNVDPSSVSFIIPSILTPSE